MLLKKLGPTLSHKIYSKLLGKKEASFESFIWFLFNFVWDYKKTKFSISVYNESILTDWTIKEYQSLSEVSIVGRNYTEGKLYIEFQNYCQYQLKVKKLNLCMLKYEPVLHNQNKEKFKKALKLTTLNYQSLNSLDFFSVFSLNFVDLDKGFRFKFKQVLSLLGYPALKCNCSSHNYLLEEVFKFFRHEYVPLESFNERNTLSIVRFVKKSNRNFNLITVCKKTEARSYSSEKLSCFS